jgi:serine/threonine protein phosphatase PrpC
MARAPKGELEALCQALIDAANAAGGPDNITVIVLEVQ